MSDNIDTIGARIKFLRQTTSNLTQQKLADATGISRGNLSNHEKDRFKPASDAIIAIANYFNVTTDWLLTGKDEIDSETYSLKSNNTDVILNHKEMNLINLFRRLREEDKLKIEGLIEYKLSEYNSLDKSY